MIVLNFLFSLLSLVVYFYALMGWFALLCSWLDVSEKNAFTRFLTNATNPWFSLFKGIKYYNTENVDFSKVVSLAVLSFVAGIISSFAWGYLFSVGRLVNQIITTVIYVFVFFSQFFAVIFLLRLASLGLKADATRSFWVHLDGLLNPISKSINNRFYPNKEVAQTKSLVTGLIFFVVLFIIFLVITALMSLLVRSIIRF